MAYLNRSILWLILGLGIMLVPDVSAQPTLSFKQLDTDIDLSNFRITKIYQDSKSFVWFGTDTGLYRYDGKKLKSYLDDLDVPPHLLPGVITDIIEDNEGNMWLSGYRLLYRYYPEKDSFSIIQPKYRGSGIYFQLLYVDSRGNHWLASNDHGLLRIDPQTHKVTSFTSEFKKEVSPGFVTKILEDSKGDLWFDYANGIYQYEWANNTLIYHPFREDGERILDERVISSIFEDSQQNLWVGATTGLFLFDRQNSKFIPYSLNDKVGAKASSVSEISEGPEGNLWLVVDGKGLKILNRYTKSIVSYPAHPTLPGKLRSNSITSILWDNQEGIFLGTWDAGAFYWNQHQKAFIKYEYFPMLSESISHASSFLERDDGEIWMTANGRLEVFDPDTETFSHQFNSQVASEITEAPNGQIWAGSWGNGLLQIDPDSPTKFRRFLSDPSSPGNLPGNSSNHVLIDYEGTLWVSVWLDGLYRYDPKDDQFIHLSLSHDDYGDKLGYTVTTMFEDHKHNLWLGTTENLLKINGEKGIDTVYYAPYCVDIYEDTEGILWLASNYGFHRLDPDLKQLKTWKKKDGLPHNQVGGILEDQDGNLWLSTGKGLSKFDPNSQAFRNYDAADGLPDDQFSSGACLKSSSGEMYFGSVSGFLRFHPDSIHDNPFVPNVNITDFRILNNQVPIQGSNGDTLAYPSPLREQISYAEEIYLNWQQNDISFEFASLNYFNPEKNQIRYRLQPYERDWIDTEGNNSSATYTNLDPGTYTFQVIGSNNDGVWNKEGASLKIYIIPPWWQTWIAYMLYTIALIGITFASYRWRTNSLRKQRQLLRKRVFEQTQEIRTEQKRSDELLLNILPATVAEELKLTGKTQPVFFEEVSIMFTDFKGFTNIVASIPGKKLVSELDDIFKVYDEIMDEVGLEKIQTVGDAYLAACGLPTPDPDHAKKCVLGAQKIIAFLDERNKHEGIKWQVRVGIHSGPITAGVIGKKKFSYDLFGDTINIAARIESSGEAGRINLSAYTYTLVKNDFVCEYRGKVNAKGKGELDMYFVS
ncbi:MAG: adenylate/guanylate cyclase domain-containing protein [Bacteroidota bacterium]